MAFKSKYKAIIAVLIIIAIIFIYAFYYSYPEPKKNVDDRMQYENHFYMVKISSDYDFKLIIPIAINGTINSTNGISLVMQNLNITKGEVTFSITVTMYGFGLNISGKGEVELQSSISSKYYYDYYTSERHIIEGTPIDSEISLSLGKIYSEYNNSNINISIIYSKSITCEMGGSSITSSIETNESWVGWKSVMIKRLFMSAP